MQKRNAQRQSQIRKLEAMTNEFKMEVDPFKVASKDASRLKINSPQRVIIDAIDFKRSKV